MNTIKTLVVIILITFSSQVSAVTEIPGDDKNLVTQQIQKFLNNSELNIYDEITVTVKFKLNSENKIIIISDDSDNFKITKFIKASLNFKELVIDSNSNKRLYSVPVRFIVNAD